MNNTYVSIDYTNYRGERGIRKVMPERIWFGNTDYHTTPQWLMDAFDVEKQASRTFAMQDIHQWLPASVTA